MPRTTLDFHRDRHDAWSAASSLREVGLGAGDVGGAWRAVYDPTASGPVGMAAVRTLEISDIGAVDFTGWLAEVAAEVYRDSGAVSLGEVLAGHVSDDAVIDEARQTIASGGGIVGVRATGAFETDLD